MNATTFGDFTARFTARIQIDRSGVGHCWQDVDPRDMRPDVLDALVDEDGAIREGATALVGGQHYRAIKAE